MIKTAASLAAVALVAAACTSGKPERVVTITRTRAPAPQTPSSPPTTGTTSASPSPTASRLTRIDGTCDTLLPLFDVSQAIGGHELSGATTFVVGVKEPAIGRIGYLNCRYGVSGKGAAAVPKVEIGVSLYASAARAGSRIVATTDDYTAHGAQATDTTVGDLPATLLTGGVGTGYSVPLLIVASGQRTIAVGVDPSVATGDQARTDATALAQLALERTGG